MRAVVTRVLRASVTVDGEVISGIGPGLLVLLGVTHTDTADQATATARKIYGLRILRDGGSVADDRSAAVLVVSQFTLYSDVRKGRRPSWSAAASGQVAQPLITAVCAELSGLGADVRTGRFGADMQVESVNDGPVTIIVDV